jgi:hypothetical protein
MAVEISGPAYSSSDAFKTKIYTSDAVAEALLERASPEPPASHRAVPGYPEMRAIAEPDTAGQRLYTLGLIGDLYRISPYSATPDRFLISLGLYYQALAIDPTTLRAFAVSSDGDLYEINLDTGGHIRQIGHVALSQPRAMAFDAGGQAYMVVNLDKNLYRLDKTTAALTIVGNTGYYLSALAFDGDGILYGTVSVGTGRGSLVRIDPRTGAATVVGNSGGMDGLAIDTDGILYGAGGSDLYRIDKNTGHTTLIGRIGISRINNLAFLRAPSSGGPPTLPNLTPYQPAGWSDKIVISSDPNSRTDSPILSPGTPLFLNWAGINAGGAPTAAQFIIDVYLDDRLLGRWSSGGPLEVGHYNYITGQRFGPLSEGTHTLQLLLDVTNAIAESNETDNLYTRSLTIAPVPTAIQVSGPASGDAFQRLIFTANTTNGCQADPLGWSWTGDATLFLDSFGASGKASASATRGWMLPGSHSVHVRNTRCGEAVATVEIRFPTRQDTQLYPDTPHNLPNLPTVVFCHGLQKKNFDNRDLWSCVEDCNGSEVNHPAGDLLDLGPGLRNNLQFVWSGAGQVSALPDAGEYIRAWEFVDEAGRKLAAALARRLPANFNQPIQFVGHSLGSVVCGKAAAQFLKQAEAANVTKAQVTVLDRPDHINKLPGDSQLRDFEQQAFDAQFFSALLNRTMRPNLNFLVDNYWSSTGLGAGDTMNCLTGAKVYNHKRPRHCPGCAATFAGGLAHPNRIGNRYFRNESAAFVIDNDHSGVQQWYRWTMDKSGQIASGGGDAEVCDENQFTSPVNEVGPVFHGSLNPCEEGWNVSIVGPADPVPNRDCDPASVAEASILACLGPGATCDSQFGELHIESTSGALETSGKTSSVSVDIPAYARNILFNLKASNPSSSLWAAVLLDSVPVWSGSLATFGNNRVVEIGPMPLYGLTGRRQLSLTILGPGNATLQLSNPRIQKVLVPCEAADALCITARRFRVEADWTDHNGNSGHAMPRYVGTDESGFMWFFGPSNVELMVKLLNGCGVNNNFWVFAGGLTDVSVRIRVTDTATGAIKIYNNPQGTAFQPIQDTKAFATCTAADIAGALDGKGTLAIAAAAVPPATDSASLGGGRFDVTATWRTSAGTNGVGHFVPVTDEAGYFWFFGPGNIEVVAKVLNGCGLNNRFWVFAAGLTDVEVDLVVADTRTGATRTYHNSLGQSFQPIQDTSAFATCP